MKRSLYSAIRKNIVSNDVEEAKEIAAFVEDLPLELRKPLSMLIFQELYENVEFLKNKSPNFLAWICPLMTSRVAQPNEIIYYENDDLNEIFFLKSGSCNYVLPRFGNTPFIKIVECTCFGLVDFVAALVVK